MLSLVRQSSNYKHIDHSETVDDGDDDDNSDDDDDDGNSDDDDYDGADIRQTGSAKEIHNASFDTNNTSIEAYMHAYTYIPDGIVATVVDETP